ncbi:MAG: DUF1521 domain-containing protein [Luteimonas sp.]|nr:DUF1521 domain-containing protein [Luteimonas sp.]
MGDFISGNLATVSAQIAAGGCIDSANAPSTSRTADGKVQFENDNYRITADDNNEVMIKNKATGENYRIWGDPHVEVDGQHAFDFWGNTTFVLDDGTRVTITTTPWEQGHNGATVASQVTILDGGGHYGARIEGVDSNTRGDLGFVDINVSGRDGKLTSSASEGNVLQENENGRGFVATDGDGRLRGVDQAFINATDEVKQHGSSMVAQLSSMFREFSGLLSVSFSGQFLSLSFDSGNEGSTHVALPLPFLAELQVDVTIGRA